LIKVKREIISLRNLHNHKMKIKLSPRLFVLALCFATISKLSAQDSTVVINKWHYLAQPYIMFPVIDGTIGLGQLPDAEMHATADDIFSTMQFGAMLYFEAHNDHWALSSDMIYVDLSQDAESKRGIISAVAGTKQFIWEAAGLRRINPWFDAGIGLRLVSMESSLDMNLDSTAVGGGGQRSKRISDTWVDPIIAGRIKLPAGKRWLFQLRADMGGFGISSNFTWQGQADVSYRLSKLLQLGLSYRILAIDYENGSGSDRFLYNVDMYGPALKIGFNF
jgi:hypothetical protein